MTGDLLIRVEISQQARRSLVAGTSSTLCRRADASHHRLSAIRPFLLTRS